MRVPIPYIVIGILIIVIVIMRSCTPKPIPCPQPSIVTTVDTILIPVNHNIPVPYPVHHYDTVEVPGTIDTAEVVKDYYSANIYDRKIVDDSTGTLILHDSVTRNKLTKSRLSGQLKQIVRTTTITNNITKPLKNRVFIGAQIGTDMNNMSLVPQLCILPKNDRTLYNIGYDPFNKYGYIGIQFKIRLKK